MLVTLKEILQIAEEKKCATGSFNTPNLEAILAVIKGAEELNVPVIIMHAEVHESFMPLEIIGPIMIEMAKKAKVPVCVHLDHGEHLDYLKRALEIGFTGIMYDGSVLPYDENVANTRLAVAMAREVGASVEAEIGVLGKRELGAGHEEDTSDLKMIYTDPDTAAQFVEATGIDALACSFGTAHGLYLKKPKLNMEVLDNCRNRIHIPIVMHGGSGVSSDDYRTVISKGVRKVNYYTYMAKAGGEAVSKKALHAQQNGSVIYFHEVVSWGIEAMKADCKNVMQIFSGEQ